MASPLPISQNPPTAVQWTLFLVLFSLPFEGIDLGYLPGSLSIAKLFGVLLFIASLWYRNICLAKIPYPFFYFIVYLGIYILMGIFIQFYLFRIFISSIVTILQLFLLFLIFSNVFRQRTLARGGLLAFSLGSVLSAMSMLMGVTGVVVEEGENGRMSALGFNANEIAIILTIGIIILVGLALEREKDSPWRTLILVALTLPNFVGLLHTGSRAGVAALLIGLAFYPLPYHGSHKKLTTLIWGGLLVIGFSLIILNDPGIWERFENAFQQGDISRENIYSHAFDMVLEKPMMGWRPIEFSYELGNRLGHDRRDPHNLFLYLFLEVGIIGAVPFFLGLWLCVHSAWKARKGNWGMMPIALIMTLLVSNLSHSFLTKKSFWLVLGIAVASASVASRTRQKVAVNFKGNNLRSLQ